MIDIAMTATMRPELIEKTLNSFFTRLFDSHDAEYRLVINIDPTGSFDDKSDEIIKIASDYVDKIKCNVAKKAYFPAAFNWVWRNCTSEFVFHLEEDWSLNTTLNFSEMISIMQENKDLAHLRLSVFRSTDTLKCWKCFFNWNGKFFECPKDQRGYLGFCGHPSLNRLSFIRGVLERMNPHTNPEKQIKGRVMGSFLNEWRYGVFQAQNASASITDIGRKWMEQHGWRKSGSNREHFTTWEKAE